MSFKPITLQEYLTSSNKYPARARSGEVTLEVIANAEKLLKAVNALLEDLKWDKPVSISSGFRTSAANAGIVNAAKKSAHMTGEAIDISDDKNQSLCKACTKEMLEKHGLYREDSDYTKGNNTNWTHLQIRPTKSGKRIFQP